MRGGWSPFACTAHTSFSSCSSFCPANTYSWSVKKGAGWWEEEEEERRRGRGRSGRRRGRSERKVRDGEGEASTSGSLTLSLKRTVEWAYRGRACRSVSMVTTLQERDSAMWKHH